MATSTEAAAPRSTERKTRAAKPKPERKPKGEKPKPPAKGEKRAPAPKAVTWASPVHPRLIFLPDKIRGAQAYKKAVRQSIFLSIGILLVTAIAYFGVAAATISAQLAYDTEQDRARIFNQELAENQAVQEYWDGFIQRKAAVSSTLESDISFSNVLDAIRSANTVGAEFTNMQLNAADQPCIVADPFGAGTAVGCMTLTGTTATPDDVGVFTSRLNGSKDIITNVFAKSNSVVDGRNTFTVEIGFNQNAISFKGKAFEPTPEEMASLATEPAPADPAAAGTTPGDPIDTAVDDATGDAP